MSGFVDGSGGEGAGWYGKLAFLGDFAGRRLPHALQQACDRWLAGGIDCSHAQLGGRWLDCYLTGPLWRFAWAPGVAEPGDPRWWFGVMMPSVDSVGRYFPLLITASAGQPPHTPAALQQLERWLDGAAQAALATLHPGASLERFEQQLASLPRWQADTPDAALGWHESAERVQVQVSRAASLADALAALASHDMLRRLRGCSVWWPLLADGTPHRFSLAVGLPPHEAFAQMLEGSW